MSDSPPLANRLLVGRSLGRGGFARRRSASSSPKTPKELVPVMPNRSRTCRAVLLTHLALAATALVCTVVTAASAAVTLKDVTLSPAAVSLVPGQTQSFRATGVFSDGSTQDLTSRVVFAARNPDVVGITAAGLATAGKSGRTEVYATDPVTGKVSRVKAQVTIAALSAMVIEPATLRLEPGAVARLHAFASYDNGVSGVDVTSTLAWSSGKRTVATVTKNADGSVVVTALKAGSALMTAKDPTTGVKSDKSTGVVTVGGASGPKLTSISIVPASLKIAAGGQAALIAIGTYDDGSSADLTAKLDWASTKPGVAGVAKNQDGTVQLSALAVGGALVSATDPATRLQSLGSTGLVQVTPKPKLVALEIVLAANAVRPGGSVAVTALGRFDDGAENVDVTSLVEWTTTDKKVATMGLTPDATLVIFGVAKGIAKVKARDPVTGVKAESAGRITVVTNLAKLAVTPAKKTIRIDTRSRLTATGTFEQGITVDLSREVQWTSSAPPIARVDAQGRVTGRSPGNATVGAFDPVTGLLSASSGGSSSVTVVGTLLAVEVTPRVLALALGEAGSLRAGGIFAGEPTSVNLSGKVDWVLSDPSVISINANGGVSCVKQGSTFVSAIDPPSSISSSVSNGDAEVLCGVPISGLSVSPATMLLKVDKTKKAKAFLTYANGTQIDVTKRVKWDSTNKFVATVENKEPNIGRIKGQSPGQATITGVDLVTGISTTGAGGASLVVTVP